MRRGSDMITTAEYFNYLYKNSFDQVIFNIDNYVNNLSHDIDDKLFITILILNRYIRFN